METGKTAPAFARLRRDQPDKRIPNPKARLQEQVREVMRFHHYSLRTEEALLAVDQTVYILSCSIRSLRGMTKSPKLPPMCQ